MQRLADNFSGIDDDSFDTVILNSVIQYFPGIDYLRTVLEQAVERVTPGGRIMVGDVRSLPLLEAYHTSVQLFQAPADLPLAQLQQRIQAHMAKEEELLIDPAFFLALQQHLPQISQVQLQVKPGQ